MNHEELVYAIIDERERAQHDYYVSDYISQQSAYEAAISKAIELASEAGSTKYDVYIKLIRSNCSGSTEEIVWKYNEE